MWFGGSLAADIADPGFGNRVSILEEFL